jgi:hypothetical protein
MTAWLPVAGRGTGPCRDLQLMRRMSIVNDSALHTYKLPGLGIYDQDNSYVLHSSSRVFLEPAFQRVLIIHYAGAFTVLTGCHGTRLPTSDRWH